MNRKANQTQTGRLRDLFDRRLIRSHYFAEIVWCTLLGLAGTVGVVLHGMNTFTGPSLWSTGHTLVFALGLVFSGLAIWLCFGAVPKFVKTLESRPDEVVWLYGRVSRRMSDSRTHSQGILMGLIDGTKLRFNAQKGKEQQRLLGHLSRNRLLARVHHGYSAHWEERFRNDPKSLLKRH